ncbi:MAG: NAD-dependent epimerase/dehydratase family protein [Elusimicrobia bacterium]|nr:NAD-dependent epimerase/dehydratase family protein [Candidatus Liberimonas magnetica]
MKILVTGGAGFIGSNIADAFINDRHKVIIVDDLSSGKKENLNNKAKFFNVDIRDKNRLSNLFKKEKIDVICHHAAQIDVRKSVSDPVLDAGINVLGTINLMENAKAFKVKKIIFASSGGTIYGECGKSAPDENYIPRPDSPYGITKHSAELYLQYYSKLFGISFTSLRYANVFGPRQDPQGEAGVVAIFSNRMLNSETVVIYGDGEQKRDYVFVKDVVKANILALHNGNSEIINIGTEKAISVNELFKSMADILDYKLKPMHKPKRTGELLKSFLNADKAKKVLGWEPIYDFKEGLRQTIDYFRSVNSK